MRHSGHDPAASLLAASLMALILLCVSITADAFGANFTGPPELVAAAEKARTESFMFWTGRDYPEWEPPCPIEWKSKNGGDEGGGGTGFAFDNGVTIVAGMTVSGSRQQVIDNVIPHEVDHAVRASIVGHKITRWLDEGLAQLREGHAVQAERSAQRFTSQQHAVIWQHMNAADYPPDSDRILSFYRCGWSVSKYLLENFGTAKVLELQRASPNLYQRWHDILGESPETTRARWWAWSEGHTSRPAVIAVVAERDCPPCEQFVRDSKTNTKRPYDFIVRRVPVNTETTPRFIAPNGQRLDGYQGWQALDQWVKGTLRLPLSAKEAIVETVAPRRRVAVTQLPNVSRDLPPEPAEVFDPENVELIVMAATTERGDKLGIAGKVGLKILRPKLERLATDKLAGKVALSIVDERTQPGRYEAMIEATGIVPEPFALVALVKRQSIGLTGLIAGRLEGVVSGFAEKLDGAVQLELIFERGHSDHYAATLNALRAAEVQPYQRSDKPADDASLKDTIKLIAIEQAKSVIGDKLEASDNALLNAIGEKLAENKPDTPPPQDGDPVQRGILSGGAGLWAMERLWSAWQRRKAGKAAESLDAKEAAV